MQAQPSGRPYHTPRTHTTASLEARDLLHERVVHKRVLHAVHDERQAREGDLVVDEGEGVLLADEVVYHLLHAVVELAHLVVGEVEVGFVRLHGVPDDLHEDVVVHALDLVVEDDGGDFTTCGNYQSPPPRLARFKTPESFDSTPAQLGSHGKKRTHAGASFSAKNFDWDLFSGRKRRFGTVLTVLRKARDVSPLITGMRLTTKKFKNKKARSQSKKMAELRPLACVPPANRPGPYAIQEPGSPRARNSTLSKSLHRPGAQDPTSSETRTIQKPAPPPSRRKRKAGTQAMPASRSGPWSRHLSLREPQLYLKRPIGPQAPNPSGRRTITSGRRLTEPQAHRPSTPNPT